MVAELDWVTTGNDLLLLSLNWIPVPEHNAIGVFQSDGRPLTEDVVARLVNDYWQKIAQLCAVKKYKFAFIFTMDKGRRKTYEIPASLASSTEPENPSKDCDRTIVLPASQKNRMGDLIIPELGLDFNGVYHNEYPIFFYDFEDGDIIFANLVATRAQNKKLKKLLGSNGASLNYSDEFERRIERVWSGEQLVNYENVAMRWWLDPETGRYRRKQMNFVSNAGRINYCGTECWYSHTLSAQETGRFVD